MSIQDLNLKDLHQQVCSLQKSLEEFDFVDVEAKAVQLISQGNQFIINEFTTADGKKFSPLPIVLKIIESLSEDSIQYCNNTKRLLSKVCRIFVEGMVYQIVSQRWRIYKDTKESMIDQLKKVKTTLPDAEVSTWFEVECSLAALNLLVLGEGFWQEIGKKEGKSWIKAAAEAVLLLSPRRLIKPSLDLVDVIYSNTESEWYGDVFALRWSVTKLTNLEDFEPIENFIGSISNIRERKEKFSLCVTEIFMDIISNQDVKCDRLKSRVFHGEGKEKPGLLDLACLEDGRGLGVQLAHDPNKFWRTRYQTIKHLDALVGKYTSKTGSPYFTASIEKIFTLFSQKDENVHIGNLLNRIITCYKNLEGAKTFYARHIRANHQQIQADIKSSKASIETKISEGKTKQENLSKELTQLVEKGTNLKKGINPFQTADLSTQSEKQFSKEQQKQMVEEKKTQIQRIEKELLEQNELLEYLAQKQAFLEDFEQTENKHK